MKIKIKAYAAIIVLMGYAGPLLGNVIFGSKESTLKFGDNAKFFVTKDLTISKGMLDVGLAMVSLRNPVELNDAIFSDGVRGSFTSSGSTNGDDKVYLSNNQRLQSLISYKPYQCIVSGTVGNESWFTGEVAFEAFDSDVPFLKFANASAALRLGLNSTGASDIELNGGTLILENDLAFATVNANCLLGGGTVECWGSTVSFGGDGFIWPTGKIAWKWRPVINLIGNVILHGRWDFGVPENDPAYVPGSPDKIYINGNGNTLDISDGKLRVVGKSTLILSNVKIKGLNVTNNGQSNAVSNIEFGDPDAKIIFNRVELEMDTDWTLTTGGIYVSGSSTIVNKNHTLTFDLGSSLTVDGCALWYDTLIFSDNNGIKPFEEADPDHHILTLLNNGQIKHITSYQAGTVLINETFETRSPDDLLRATTPVTYDIASFRDLSPTKPYAVNVDAIINGHTNAINFAQTTDSVIKIKAGKTLTFQDIVLNDFMFSHVGLLGTTSHVIFGDGTNVLWGANYALTQTMTFQGECILDGKGKTITLSRFGGFAIAPDSSLLLQNITIKGLFNEHLECLDNTSTISFGGNVTLFLSDDVFFRKGHFEVMPAAILDVRGTDSFVYQSDQPSFINSGGTLQLSGGAIFYYDIKHSYSRDLIVFNDEDANLKLNKGTLASTSTGMRLTYGTLQVVGDENYIRAADITSPTMSESIVFGDGVDVMNNLFVEFSNGTLMLESGALVWANLEDNL